MIVIYVTNPSNSRGLTAKWSNLTTLEEHRKVYRQIQDCPKINAGDIVQHRRNIRTVQHPDPGKDADVVEIQFQEILG